VASNERKEKSEVETKKTFADSKIKVAGRMNRIYHVIAHGGNRLIRVGE